MATVVHLMVAQAALVALLETLMVAQAAVLATVVLAATLATS